MRVKNIKKILLVLLFLILIIAAFVFYNVFGNYKAATDVEAIDAIMMSESCDKVLYQYETDNKEIFLYVGDSGQTYECILNKRTVLGETRYKNYKCWTSGLVDWNSDWNIVDKNLKYAIVERESDIEAFDCEGFEPLSTKIEWYEPDGSHQYRWVYVIDKNRM